MGWGLTIKDVFLSKITKKDLESKLEDNKSLIRMYEGDLIALASYTHPTIKNGDFSDGEEISIVEYMPMKIREIMDSLEEIHGENRLIYIALSDLDNIVDDF